MSVTVASRTTVKGQTSVGGFSPASLFLNNEQGVWYDPSDMTTMFQDSALTTPVTGVEQPVGFLMDKSRGATLGSELIINGEFNSSSSWILVGGWSVSGGKLVGTGATNWARQDNIITSGKWYKVSFEVSSYTGGNTIRICNTSGVALVSFYVAGGAPNTYTGYFLATGTSVIIEAATTPFSGTIDNFSIRELPGNHAYQSTSANRPVLSARVNLATYSQSLATGSAWPVGGSSLTLTNNAAADPYGGNAATLAVETTATSIHFIEQTVNNAVANLTYTMSCFFKKGTRRYVYLCHGTSTTTFCGAVFDLDTANAVTVAQSSGFGASNAKITSVGNGWYRCSVDISQPSNIVYIDIGFRATAYTSGSIYESYTGSTSENGYWFGADLRPANQGVNLPVYQRVGAATYGTSTTAGVGDYDTTNFPMYLKFDGSVDSGDFLVMPLSVSTLNMNIWSGFMETGNLAVNSRVMMIGDSTGNANNLGVVINGSTSSGSIGYRLPENDPVVINVYKRGTNIISYQRSTASLQEGKLNGISLTPITNATTTFTSNNGRIGCGFSGSIENTFLNGYLYGLIIRGASSNALQIAGAENWLNQKTKAYA